MPKAKMVLDTLIEVDFELLAIHCSLEPYRIAYYMNSQLGLKLKRVNDIEIVTGDETINLPIFHYFDEFRETDFFLVANKYKSKRKVQPTMDLFGEKRTQTKDEALLSEYKGADYLLKIEDDVIESVPLKKIMSDINQIRHVVTTYSVDLDILKHKDRLIFR